MLSEREQFEAAWHKEYPLHSSTAFTRSGFDPERYANTRVQDGWLMWQAASATPADQEPVAIYQVMLGEDNSGDWVDVHPSVFEQTSKHRQRIVYAKAPQPEAQSVRDAVIEECVAAIRKAEFSKQDGEYMTGMEAVSAIRALKSAPPQKPVSDEVKP